MLNFSPLTSNDIDLVLPYFYLRKNPTCDSVFFDVYLWKDYYNLEYAIDDNAIFFKLKVEDEIFSTLPICKDEDLKKSFEKLKNYFNNVLNQKLRIYLADENAINILNLEPNDFYVKENEDAKDYIYSANALKTLSGKKLRKKKNHINAFLKENKDNFEYKKLSQKDTNEIWSFLSEWKNQKGETLEKHLIGEIKGIKDVLQNFNKLEIKMAGIYINNKLQAFSIGSFNKFYKMAIIHIEKANPEIRGLYPYINQQFLINEFNDAEIVNREDDMGLPGLRKAKLSYDPIYYAIKYRIIQK